jgi:hypothetical protein
LAQNYNFSGIINISNYFASMFFKKYRPVLLLVLFCTACNKKDNQLQQVMALQQMNDLATVEYVVTKIIKANDNKTWYKIGDRKILMSCKATLTAGIDLSKITSNQVNIEGKNITLTLPHSKMIAVNIKPEDIVEEYEQVDVLRQTFTGEERNALAIQAENQINASIAELGILQTAETNAALFVNNFLHRLGFEKIIIHFDTITPTKN